MPITDLPRTGDAPPPASAGSDADRAPIYGYMRADESTPEMQVLTDELRLFRWAQLEGYDLVVIYRDTDSGGDSELRELVHELGRCGDRAVVVPTAEHLDRCPPLQQALRPYVVHIAEAELCEANRP